jgi:hypothetical protein
MKTKLSMCLLVLGVMVTSAWATPTNYFFPSSFTENPQGEWSLGYGAGPSSITPMAPAGVGKWNSNGTRPTYGEYGQEFRFWDNTNDSAYLIFTCPETGNYSVNFNIYAEKVRNNHWGIYSYVNVGTLTDEGYSAKYSASNPWGNGPYTHNLKAVSELQEMSLSEGDKILVGLKLQKFDSYTEIVFRIQPSSTTPDIGANIGFVPVPEPATIGLLTIGGLLLRRRK